MTRYLALIGAVFALVIPAAATSAPVRGVLCGPQCGGGSGFPPCNDLTIGVRYNTGGHQWICLFGNPDYWHQVY